MHSTFLSSCSTLCFWPSTFLGRSLSSGNSSCCGKSTPTLQWLNAIAVCFSFMQQMEVVDGNQGLPLCFPSYNGEGSSISLESSVIPIPHCQLHCQLHHRTYKPLVKTSHMAFRRWRRVGIPRPGVYSHSAQEHEFDGLLATCSDKRIKKVLVSIALKYFIIVVRMFPTRVICHRSFNIILFFLFNNDEFLQGNHCTLVRLASLGAISFSIPKLYFGHVEVYPPLHPST